MVSSTPRAVTTRIRHLNAPLTGRLLRALPHRLLPLLNAFLLGRLRCALLLRLRFGRTSSSTTSISRALTVPPQRILMATGRGASKRDPPTATLSAMDIPKEVVEETLSDLSKSSGDAVLRTQLSDFTALYKFVVDTVVKRARNDASWQAKINHSCVQLTPEAVRGMKVMFELPGGRKMVEQSPTFNNMHTMKNPATLAVIMVMKVRKDPFFLWLLVLFSRGARAPTEKASSEAAAVTPKKGTKRSRPPPAAGADEGRGSGDGSGSGSGAGAGVFRGPGVAGLPAGESGAPSASGPPRDASATDVVRAAQRPPAFPPLGGAAAVGAVGAPVASSGPPAGRLPVGSGATGITNHAGVVSKGDVVVRELGARFLLRDGEVVATAELHPEFSEFHSAPIPLSIVACFLRTVAPGCEDVEYPFGQDGALCLEKGYPSGSPVPLRAIGQSYKIAWPVCDVGYDSAVDFLAGFCVWCEQAVNDFAQGAGDCCASRPEFETPADQCATCFFFDDDQASSPIV